MSFSDFAQNLYDIQLMANLKWCFLDFRFLHNDRTSIIHFKMAFQLMQHSKKSKLNYTSSAGDSK